MNESPRKQEAGEASPTDSRRPSRRRRFWITGGVALLATVAAFAAFSRSPAFPHPEGMGGYNEARVELLLEHMLFDASDAQRDRIGAIVKDTVSQVRELRTVNELGRHDVLRLLSQPTVDRVAIEQLRAEQMGVVDEASRLITDGLLEASEVLTPAQRAALAQRLEKRWE